MIELSTLQAVREIVTIVGVIAGLSYYFLTVQNANKARKIQLTLRMWGLFQDSEISKVSLELLEMQWEDFDDFLRKYDSTVNQENYSKRSKLFNMFSEIGYLLNNNLIGINEVYDITNSYVVLQMWRKFEPILLKHREVYEDPTRYQWFEYLVKELVKERVKRGLPSGIPNVDGYWTQ